MGQASIELTQGVRRPAALRLLSDDRLGRRAAEGDRGAFAVIFERHHQGLYRYCRAILRHDEDARDALQTTFTRAISALDGEQRTVAIKPWLYRIAHNEAISLVRRRRPHDPLDCEPQLAADASGPEDRVLKSERMRQLLSDLEQLPERQRWALLLRELNDLTYADIAAAITTTEQAARQSVYEARVMLTELKEGREMPCADVRRLISERDGRLLRPRKVRAHLKACTPCTDFRTAIGTRRADFGSLAPPLPAAAAAALLNALLGGGGGGGWGGGGLAAALSAGKGLVAGASSKGLATATALTIAGGAIVTTGGSIDDPHSGHRGNARPSVLEARASPAPTPATVPHVSGGFGGHAAPAVGPAQGTPVTHAVTRVTAQQPTSREVPQALAPAPQTPVTQTPGDDTVEQPPGTAPSAPTGDAPPRPEAHGPAGPAGEEPATADAAPGAAQHDNHDGASDDRGAGAQPDGEERAHGASTGASGVGDSETKDAKPDRTSDEKSDRKLETSTGEIQGTRHSLSSRAERSGDARPATVPSPQYGREEGDEPPGKAKHDAGDDAPRGRGARDEPPGKAKHDTDDDEPRGQDAPGQSKHDDVRDESPANDASDAPGRDEPRGNSADAPGHDESRGKGDDHVPANDDAAAGGSGDAPGKSAKPDH